MNSDQTERILTQDPIPNKFSKKYVLAIDYLPRYLIRVHSFLTPIRVGEEESTGLPCILMKTDKENL